jgi:hypothetical protein
MWIITRIDGLNKDSKKYWYCLLKPSEGVGAVFLFAL